MRMTRVCAAFMAVTVVTLLGAAAEAQQLPKSGKYTGKFGGQGLGQPYELEKGHVFWVGRALGVFFNDVADGFLDKSAVTCPTAMDIVDGVIAAYHGYCVMTDKDGDKAFAVWQGKGTAPGSAAGTFQWTGGTGKFVGLQGNNTFRDTGIGKEMAGSVVWEGEWRLP
jgi:hypothetical protein